MVAVAQSVERLVVVQEVAGSSPVGHPIARPNSSSINSEFWVSLFSCRNDVTSFCEEISPANQLFGSVTCRNVAADFFARLNFA